MDANDFLAPSGDVIKYKTEWQEGTVLQGTLLRAPSILPDTDYQTKEQKVSKKGNPLWKFKLVIEVGGEAKTLFPDGPLYWETLNAFKAAGLRDFNDSVGGTIAFKRIEDEPSKTPGFAPRKNYKVKFVLAD